MTRVTGFVPTVTDHTQERDGLVLHTLDGRQETDLLVTDDDDGPIRRAEAMTEEQRDQLELQE